MIFGCYKNRLYSHLLATPKIGLGPFWNPQWNFHPEKVWEPSTYGVELCATSSFRSLIQSYQPPLESSRTHTTVKLLFFFKLVECPSTARRIHFGKKRKLLAFLLASARSIIIVVNVIIWYVRSGVRLKAKMLRLKGFLIVCPGNFFVYSRTKQRAAFKTLGNKRTFPVRGLWIVFLFAFLLSSKEPSIFRRFRTVRRKPDARTTHRKSRSFRRFLYYFFTRTRTDDQTEIKYVVYRKQLATKKRFYCRLK